MENKIQKTITIQQHMKSRKKQTEKQNSRTYDKKFYVQKSHKNTKHKFKNQKEGRTREQKKVKTNQK